MASVLDKKIGQVGHLVPKPQINLIKREETKLFTKANIAMFLILGIIFIFGTYFGVIRRYQEVHRLDAEYTATSEEYATLAAEASMFERIQKEYAKYDNFFIRENALFSSIVDRQDVLDIIDQNLSNKLNIIEIKTTENLASVKVEKTTLREVTEATSELKKAEPGFVKDVEYNDVSSTNYNGKKDEYGNEYVDLTIWVRFISED